MSYLLPSILFMLAMLFIVSSEIKSVVVILCLAALVLFSISVGIRIAKLDTTFVAARAAIEECEATIPRNQKCKAVAVVDNPDETP